MSCNGFRFQTEESETTEEKLTGVETVEKVDPEPIVPEYEDDETEAKSRQEKKIDPLVVDVERKPIDEITDGDSDALITNHLPFVECGNIATYTITPHLTNTPTPVFTTATCLTDCA